VEIFPLSSLLVESERRVENVNHRSTRAMAAVFPTHIYKWENSDGEIAIIYNQ